MMDRQSIVQFPQLHRRPIPYTQVRKELLSSALSRLPPSFHHLQSISTSPQS